MTAVHYHRHPAPKSDEVAELHAERHRLCSLIEDQRAEITRLHRKQHETERQLAAARRELRRRGRRWGWFGGA